MDEVLNPSIFSDLSIKTILIRAFLQIFIYH